MEMVIIAIAYIAIGCFINGWIKNRGKSHRYFLVIAWPVLIFSWILIGFMWVMYSMGEKISKKMWKSEQDD